MPTIRLLPFAIADGPTNMASDEALVRTAASGDAASLRLYGWTAATLSLGYFQPHSVRLCDARLASLPWVRRPSGGATLVHHHEVTYCLALPASMQATIAWMPRMHGIITAALADVGLAGKFDAVRGQAVKHGDVLCFQQHTPGDLLSGVSKVVGSAQRKYHQALMQHGSILITQSEYTPSLPGISELTGVTLTPGQLQAAVVTAFERDTGWQIMKGDWSKLELDAIVELRDERYGSTEWNERR